MATIHVRDFPERLFHNVKVAAALDRKSIKDYVIDALKEAVNDTRLREAIEIKSKNEELKTL